MDISKYEKIESLSKKQKINNICENMNNIKYILPDWFNYTDLSNSPPTQNGFIILSEKQYEKLLYNICHSKKFVSLAVLDNYIKSEELYNRYFFLYKLLKNKHKYEKYDWNSNEAKEILKIKICDYDWKFYHINFKFDKKSTQLLFRHAITFIEKLKYYKFKLLNNLDICHTFNMNTNTLCSECLIHHIGERKCFDNDNEIIEHILKLVDNTQDINKIIYWNNVICEIQN